DGAPKSARARMTRPALSGVASIHTSRSPVARGLPWSASAYAPTMRKRTSAAMNARNRSTKSGFIAQLAAEAPEFLAEPPYLEDSLPLGNLPPELEVVAVGLRRRLEASRDETSGAVGRLLSHGKHYGLNTPTANLPFSSRVGAGRRSLEPSRDHKCYFLSSSKMIWASALA